MLNHQFMLGARNQAFLTEYVLFNRGLRALLLILKALYERLIAKGKSKMSALGAATRKLVHLCFGVLKSQMLYQANYAIWLDRRDGIYAGWIRI